MKHNKLSIMDKLFPNKLYDWEKGKKGQNTIFIWKMGSLELGVQPGNTQTVLKTETDSQCRA